MGAGVAACYRGDRIYDTPKTKAVVKKWVDFYKVLNYCYKVALLLKRVSEKANFWNPSFQKYRSILNSDVVHVRRGDMQSVDSFLHVNPGLTGVKGLAMFFNPTGEHIKGEEIEIDLYYTGLEAKAKIRMESGKEDSLELDRQFKIYVKLGERRII